MKSAEKIKQIFLNIIDWFLVEPKRLVRLIVLSICSIVVFFQLWECAMKLLHPPISTHSHFDLNETMFYPAVTFCREPAFKVEVMSKYNLSRHPSLNQSWKNFSFDNYSLSNVFEEATYSRDEFFSRYGLDGHPENIKIESSMHFSMGRCFTMKPEVSTSIPWKDSGYYLTLRHDYVGKVDEEPRSPQGFHVYLHEPRESFTEHGILSSGRIEYLYMEANEEIELKLTVQHFTQFRGRGSSCSDDPAKSLSMCSEKCRWRAVEDSTKCSGPWMTDANTLQCNNYHDVLKLINQYQYLSNIDDSLCGCVEPCYSIIYSSFVMSRRRCRNLDEPGSKLYIYYTSKMVTNIEERAGYDFSQFVADMGGSLGFLLGLSVIGLIVVIEKILGYWFLNDFIERYKENKRKRLEKDEKPEKIIA